MIKVFNYKKITRVVFPIALLVSVILGCTSGGTSYNAGDYTYTYDPSNDTITVTANSNEGDDGNSEEPLKDYGIKTADSYEEMTVGDIGEKKGMYVGLSYVKKMPYVTDALGGKVEVSSSNSEAIVGFFEFFNGTGELESVSPSDITCYADGVQVAKFDNTFKIKIDGVERVYSAELEPETKVLSCQDFEVPKEWKEIKFFYESVCIWTIHPEDVKTEDYVFNPMFENYINMDATPVETSIYNDKYEVVYQGYTFFTENNMIYGDQEYVVFKFKVNNTSDASIDYSSAGHKMRLYQNDYALDDASYTLDDKIDGYINIFDIDSIEKGMSANVYVAFKVDDKNGNYYMAYDDGYITSDLRGYVYVNN